MSAVLLYNLLISLLSTETLHLAVLDHTEAVIPSLSLHPGHLHPVPCLGVQLVDLVTILVIIVQSSCNYNKVRTMSSYDCKFQISSCIIMTKLSTLSSHLWCKWCYPVWQLSVQIMVVVKLCSLSRLSLPVGGFQWRRDSYLLDNLFPPWPQRPESDNIVISVFSSLYYYLISSVCSVHGTAVFISSSEEWR